jgi:serine/threonine protein kinase
MHSNLELAWKRFYSCLQVLSEFHAAGLFHGDCKLENFMFDSVAPDARPVLIDFESLGGKCAATACALGAASFAAPECWRTHCLHPDCPHPQATKPADVFSLTASFLIRFGIKTPALLSKSTGWGRAVDVARYSCPRSYDIMVTGGLMSAKSYWPQCALQLEQLVLWCCSPNLDARWSAEEALCALG